MSPTDIERYEASRRALAASHDKGAAVALRDCIDADVRCGRYCLGGYPIVDITETLAELADQGWRLTNQPRKARELS